MIITLAEVRDGLSGLLGLAVFSTGLWIRDRRQARRVARLQARLHPQLPGSVLESPDPELEAPLLARAIPIHGVFAWLGSKIVPAQAAQEMGRKLQQAGLKTSPALFMVYRVILGGVLLLLGAGLAHVKGGGWPLPDRLALPLGLGVMGYAYPGIHLGTAAQKRAKTLQRSLPDVFDILGVSVEAGLAFDAAMSNLVDHLDPGPARDEFGRYLRDRRLGIGRAEALKAMAARTRSVPLKRFASLVSQADQAGSSMAEPLKIQAADIKAERAAQAREEAAKIPIKILFPMVAFILPSIFVAILGPAVLSLMRDFSHGL
ncbi:MAG: type II secretion system F family protein [Thermaerobacter sp.]|nr:type II secretion system F family protein [Thermaerobacter sp.]